MSRLDKNEEFTDVVFTRDRRAWWQGMSVPGVNVCTDERMDVNQAFETYLPWTVRKVELYDPETFEPSKVYVHKRSDKPIDTDPIGKSGDRFVLIQNSEVSSILTSSFEGMDYAVASIGALKNGAITFVSVDFVDAPDINIAGQQIHPFLAVVNAHDGHGSLKVCATGIRPECLNTIDAGWLSGTRLGRLSHTTNIWDKIPAVQNEIRRYLDLLPIAEKTVGRLIDTTISPVVMRKAIENMVRIPSPMMKDGKVKNQAAITRQEAKRDQIIDLVSNDPRVGFEGTAWGLFQAFSTYDQQDRGFRRTPQSGVGSRKEASLTSFFSGKQVDNDERLMRGILNQIDSSPVKVTSSGLVLV